jgi:hypothetical protein
MLRLCHGLIIRLARQKRDQRKRCNTEADCAAWRDRTGETPDSLLQQVFEHHPLRDRAGWRCGFAGRAVWRGPDPSTGTMLEYIRHGENPRQANCRFVSRWHGAHGVPSTRWRRERKPTDRSEPRRSPSSFQDVRANAGTRGCATG